MIGWSGKLPRLKLRSMASNESTPEVDPVLHAFLLDKINNPLTIIAAEAELLRMNDGHGPYSEVREAADHIIAQCRYIAAVLSGLRGAGREEQ